MTLSLILLLFFHFYFYYFCRCRCFYCDDFFFFFASFVFDCKFEMFYVTIIDIVIKKFIFTTLFDFLNDRYDVIFNDIILRKFVEMDNEINNQKKIVIINNNNFKRICILSFVNMNHIRKSELKFVNAIIIKKFMFRNLTINERTSVFYKIRQIYKLYIRKLFNFEFNLKLINVNLKKLKLF